MDNQSSAEGRMFQTGRTGESKGSKEERVWVTGRLARVKESEFGGLVEVGLTSWALP